MNHTNVVAGRANQHRSVARMERSVIRDRCVRTDGIPDCAALHPGYKTLRCPSGKTRKPWVNARRQNIPLYRNSEMTYVSRNPAQGRGAYRDRHERGRAAVDVDHTGAKGFAGRATVSESVTPTTGAVRVRPNRVVLAPGV
ncbi:hypothetical protein [Bradyrhizobium sp. BR 1432]|uniref:hypothetical protein n=1 Tax=Bradyrhizobium sp. BR 1432 TaxID=3447966 RepID=UPI003EE7FE37